MKLSTAPGSREEPPGGEIRSEENQHLSQWIEGQRNLLYRGVVINLFAEQDKQDLVSSGIEQAVAFIEKQTQGIRSVIDIAYEQGNIEGVLGNQALLLKLPRQYQKLTIEQREQYVSDFLQDVQLREQSLEMVSPGYRAYALRLLQQIPVEGRSNESFTEIVFLTERLAELCQSEFLDDTQKKAIQKRFLHGDLELNEMMISDVEETVVVMESLYDEYMLIDDDQKDIPNTFFQRLSLQQQKKVVHMLQKRQKTFESFQQKHDKFQQQIADGVDAKFLVSDYQVLKNACRQYIHIEAFCILYESINDVIRDELNEEVQGGHMLSLDEAREEIEKIMKGDKHIKILRLILMLFTISGYDTYFDSNNGETDAYREVSEYEGSREWYRKDYTDLQGVESVQDLEADVDPYDAIQSFKVEDDDGYEVGVFQANMNPFSWNGEAILKAEELTHPRNSSECGNSLVSVFENGEDMWEKYSWESACKKLDDHFRRHLLFLTKPFMSRLLPNDASQMQSQVASFGSSGFSDNVGWGKLLQHGHITDKNFSDGFSELLVDEVIAA